MSEQVKPLRIQEPAILTKGRLSAGLILLVLTTVGTVVNLFMQPRVGIQFMTMMTMFWFFGIAIVHIFKGLKSKAGSVRYKDGPGDFFDYNEIRRGMHRNPMTVYEEMQGLVRLIFGEKTRYLSPLERGIFKRNTSGLGWKIPVGCLVLLSCLGNLVASPSPSGLAMVLVCSFFLLSVILDIFSSFALIPKKTPDLGGDGDSEFYKAFGHPTHLYSRLPLLGRDLQLGSFANRVYVRKGEEASGTVSDVGTFNGEILVERQPEIAPYRSVGVIYLWMGLGFQILAVVVINLLGSMSVAATETGSFLISTTLMALFGSYFGYHYLSQASRLLTVLRFRSIFLSILVQGEMTRADVQVGRGMSDSVGSNNLAVRSNFTATFMAAELISEASDTDARRHLLSLKRTEESVSWIAFYKNKINELRETGVIPTGIDFQASESAGIIQANHQLALSRASAPSYNQDENVLNALPAPIAVETKECPDCAEDVRVKARKCRFCGFEFA